MTEHEIEDDETMRRAADASIHRAAYGRGRSRAAKVAVGVAVAVVVRIVLAGALSSSPQHTPKFDVSALDQDIAAQLPSELAVMQRIPPMGCLDHFLSDPKVKVVPCDQPHLSELIGPQNKLAPPGQKCTDARGAVLGPDVVELHGVSVISFGRVTWGPAEATCELRYDAPMTGTAVALAPLLVVKGVWALDPGTCLPTADPDARAVDCNQAHQAEVVSGPVLRPDGSDIGELCTPPMRAYLSPDRASSSDQVEFVWRKDAPKVGRCLVVFAAPRTGRQRR